LTGDTLTYQQLMLGLSEGRLQGAIGRNKDAIVGPGIMTENDALRIIARLGGNVDWQQNPEILRALIVDLYDEQMAEINFMKEEVDYQRAGMSGRSAYPAHGLPASLRIQEPPPLTPEEEAQDVEDLEWN
jgi:hypothetical protein